MNAGLAKRMRHAAIIVVGLALALGAKLLDIQVRQHPALAARLAKQQTREIVLHAHRGAIYDRNGEALASEAPTYDIEVHIPTVQDPDGVAAAVARAAGGRTETWRKRILAYAEKNPDRSVVLVHDLPWDEQEIEALAATPGIVVTERRGRAYAMGSAAGQLLGCLDADGHGQQGLEKDWDAELSGRDGRASMRLTPGPKVQPPGGGERVSIRLPVIGAGQRVIEEPADGASLYLTIDARVQAIAEEELAAGMSACQAKAGTVIVMHPRTGDILALANAPSFDPNSRAARRQPSGPYRRNLALGMRYEPGSVTKPLVAAAALDAGAVLPSSTFKCSGALRSGGSTVRCWVGGKGHGVESLGDMIRQSCNVGAALVAKALGAKKTTTYLEKFGLNNATLPGCSAEGTGFVPRPQDLVPSDVLRLGFGQAFSVTPIGLARAYTVFANDGVMVQPRLVHKTVDPVTGAATVLGSAQGVRVLQPAAARAVLRMMCDVVERGTGKNASVPGIEVAGKTGTAQKAVPGKGFGGGGLVVSFIGMFPADSPTYLVLAVFDEPQKMKWGSVAAAPVFRRIAVRLADRDGLSRSAPQAGEQDSSATH